LYRAVIGVSRAALVYWGWFMKLKIKKIFRYPFVDIYMLFAYCIAFVALFFAISVFDEIFNYKNDV
jgi:multidrug transporter EmrE-like cation transporter